MHALGSKIWIKFSIKKTPEQFETEEEEEEAEYYSRILFKLHSQSVSQSVDT